MSFCFQTLAIQRTTGVVRWWTTDPHQVCHDTFSDRGIDEALLQSVA